MPIDLKKLPTEEIIGLYPEIIKELKHRDVIQSKNLVGEIGEFLAISHYNKTSNLSNLKRADPSTKNLDAISRNGDRYAIKATSTTATGAFWGLNDPENKKKDKQRFEFVIIVIFDKNYELTDMLEIDWEQFLELKRWHSRVNAWSIPINKKLRLVAKKII